MHYFTTQKNYRIVQLQSERNELLAQVAKRAELLVLIMIIGIYTDHTVMGKDIDTPVRLERATRSEADTL